MHWAGEQSTLDELRARISVHERSGAYRLRGRSVLFGMPPVDRHLPGNGLALGALHEVAGTGPDVEHAAAATLFAAGVLARRSGPVLWALERRDVFAPGLSGVGLHPDRVVYVEARRPKAVLLVMEEALRHPGLAGVVGELGGCLTLTASRRLQLAAEASGGLAVLLRRSPRHDDPVLDEPTAAVTRWRVTCLPAGPARPQAPDVPGLARARWRLDLVRCRGGEAASWTVEACDAQGRLGMAADVADGQAATARGRLRAAG